ncbi:hypothetical protein E1A91_A11G239200v1 [Gossypium mustelinum]|uniref:Uncharacterized protein n=1 Tax=Gossypium mustelinum TaxID=34275 RepID=A0A5D2XAZ9_GOSMU|nr:hypothetical protein E1A91_A11G239200v1 [Gossypium mustelinum]
MSHEANTLTKNQHMWQRQLAGMASFDTRWLKLRNRWSSWLGHQSESYNIDCKWSNFQLIQ